MGQPATGPRDLEMLGRCIELSRQATTEGENPFACVICEDDRVVAEATTRAKRDSDTTRHAEMLAMAEARRILGSNDLSRCTLYANVEPCAMCSFCIRELGVRRVLYCIPSPIMGGRSRWNILGDSEISDALPEVFRGPPEIVGGLLQAEAERVWRAWHPLDWAVLRHRNAIGTDSLAAPTSAPARDRGLWSILRSWLGGTGRQG